jgi:hypothetical protein
MNRKIEEMLHTLREAIDEAIADSPDVGAIMADLEHAGICPSFSVDVALPAARASASLEVVRTDGPLILNAEDDEFLKDLGIHVAS